MTAITMIKKLPFTDFKFDVPASGPITFKIMFEAGILPTEWPEARERKSRGAKVTPVTVTPTKQAQADEATQEAAQETTALAIIQPDPLAVIIEAEANGCRKGAHKNSLRKEQKELAFSPPVRKL